MKRGVLAATVLLSALAGWEWYASPTVQDRLYWPKSAEHRIETFASDLRRFQGPAQSCYSSSASANLLNKGLGLRSEFGNCVSNITPVSGFIEEYPGEYIKRYYRATSGRYLCEVTLSTMRGLERLVGSDCYFGLFEIQENPVVGITDDPFG